MNGIKMSDCKFYVNEAERTVVCVIPHTEDMLMDFIYDHFTFSKFDIGVALGWHGRRDCYMPKSFCGKAVCSANDEWDEELGRRIAFSRAKDKCYKSFFRRANGLVNMIDMYLGRMMEQFNSFGDKCVANKERLDASIEHYLDKKEKGEA